ncbi:MAG: hypothetical protein HKN68_12720 [Saprospiraceae bacterium]|nr:hypothetical protein [Saprospiraceae bacterium]
MPTENTNLLNTIFQNLIGSHFWKGDMTRFGTHGDQNCLLLLPNPRYKKG